MCNYDESRLFAGRHIPWHWHDWIELHYLETGSYLLHAPDLTLEASQGDVVFINRNVLHSYDFPQEVNYYAYTFVSPFLAGEFGSYLDEKYFAPILRSKSLSVVHIRPNTPHRIRMVDLVLQITDALREEPFGYEILIRNCMGRFFLLLQEEARETLAQEKKGKDRDLERMQQMLSYIYSHYRDPIGLEEIAAAAGISGRECTQCFRRAIDRPPVRFQIEYRAQMAAMMPARTNDAISIIAERCGFVSDSHFGKTFRDIYGCTPREYRKHALGTVAK